MGPSLFAGYGHSSLHTVTSAMSLVIAMLCAPIWVMLSLAASETYPTPIRYGLSSPPPPIPRVTGVFFRNIAAAFCATFNRLGGVVVPQFLYLVRAPLRVISDYVLSYVLIGSLLDTLPLRGVWSAIFAGGPTLRYLHPGDQGDAIAGHNAS